MSFPPEEVTSTVQRIADILKRREETISVSEAACGGLLSAYLVSVPGASNWFHGGTLVYSLKSRLKLGGWSQEDIDNYTGPSEKVVLRLARNLRIDLGSTYVLSETGIAGPLIQTANKESTKFFADEDIGTVYLGVATPEGEVSKIHKTGNVEDRSSNMQEFAKIGLEFFLTELERIDQSEGKESKHDDTESTKKKQKV
jgi:PncC family amidohydrolase